MREIPFVFPFARIAIVINLAKMRKFQFAIRLYDYVYSKIKMKRNNALFDLHIFIC